MIITVAGRHEESHAPQRGVVALQIGLEHDDVAVAMAEVQATARALRAELEALDRDSPATVAEWHLEAPTTRSWHPYAGDGTVAPLRHAVRLRAEVTFADVAALAPWCARWGATPNVQISAVRWELEESTRAALRERVQAEAVRDGVGRAAVLARAAGANDVSVTQIADPGLLGAPGGGGGVDGVSEAMPLMAKARMADAGGDAVELAPRDVVVGAEVHLRLEAR